MCNQFSTFLQHLAEKGLAPALAVFGVAGAASGGFFLAGIACLGGASLLSYVRAKRAEAFRDTRERLSAHKIKDIHDFISALQEEIKLPQDRRISLRTFQAAAEDPERLDQSAAGAIAQAVKVVTEEAPQWIHQLLDRFDSLDLKLDQRWEITLAAFDSIQEIKHVVEEFASKVQPRAVIPTVVLPPLPSSYVRREAKLAELDERLVRADTGLVQRSRKGTADTARRFWPSATRTMSASSPLTPAAGTSCRSPAAR